MTIMEYATKVDCNDVANFQLQNLTTNVKDVCTRYLTLLSKYNAEDHEYITYSEIQSSTADITKYLKAATKAYRQYVHNVSPEYKRHSMVVQSYMDQELLDCIGDEFKFDFRHAHDRAKLTYSEIKYRRAVSIALSFLFAKYPSAYDFQIYATLVMVMVECFDVDKIDSKLMTTVESILSLGIDYIMGIKDFYFCGLDDQKHKKQKKQKEQKAVKHIINLPTREQFLQYEASGKYSTRKALIEAVAKICKCSVRTVKARLKEYGLTRGYKTGNTEVDNQGQTPIVLAPAEEPTEVKACGGFNILADIPAIEVKRNDIIERVKTLIHSGYSNSAIARKLKISINKLYVLYEENPELIKAKKNIKNNKK